MELKKCKEQAEQCTTPWAQIIRIILGIYATTNVELVPCLALHRVSLSHPAFDTTFDQHSREGKFNAPYPGGRLPTVLMRPAPRLSVKTRGGVQPGVGGGGCSAGGRGGGGLHSLQNPPPNKYACKVRHKHHEGTTHMAKDELLQNRMPSFRAKKRSHWFEGGF